MDLRRIAVFSEDGQIAGIGKNYLDAVEAAVAAEKKPVYAISVLAVTGDQVKQAERTIATKKAQAEAANRLEANKSTEKKILNPSNGAEASEASQEQPAPTSKPAPAGAAQDAESADAGKTAAKKTTKK